jgi:hypothetical protein
MKTTLSILILFIPTIYINSSVQAQSWDFDGQATSGESIGTTNGQPFTIITFNEPRLTVTALGNIGIGTGSPTYLLDVNGGDINLADDADFYRIAGWEALFMDAPGNMMVGTRHPLSSLTSGINNVLVGRDCGKFLTTGNENTFFGTFAGKVSTTAENCTFVGHQAGTANTSGGLNTFLGNRAGVKNIEGHKNIFIGYRCGQNMTYGDDNVFAGSWSGSDLTDTTGNNQNVILGSQAGYNGPGSLTKASRVTLVGYNAEASDTLTNAGAIGANAYVEAKNALVLGSIAGVNGAGGAENTNVGIGTTTPDNRLEIVRGAQGSNVSGLRLWSLVGSTPYSPSGAVLTIDGNGDVILVEASGGGGDTTSIGNYCSETQNPVSENYEIPLDSANYYFTGLEDWVDNVGIGIPCNAQLGAKLHVYQENWTQEYIPHDPNNSYAGLFEDNAHSNTYWGVGVAGLAYGEAEWNFGGLFSAFGAIDNNVGVYASAPVDSGVNFAGFFNGDVYATSMYLPSDSKLKTDIETLESGLSILLNLNPKQYLYQKDRYPQLELPYGRQYGFLAQEMQMILPSLTKQAIRPSSVLKGQTSDELEFNTINYQGLIPIVVKAIQEQQVIIDQKTAEIASLEMEVQRLSGLESDLSNLKRRLADLENKK